MSTVGPYHNRQETYSYFSLAFCLGPKPMIGHYHETLSEALQGIELKFSGLDIEFKSNNIFFSHEHKSVSSTDIVLLKLLLMSYLFAILSDDVAKTQYCETALTEVDYKAFVYAVKNQYWYQMYIDNLPIWGKSRYRQSVENTESIYRQSKISKIKLNFRPWIFQESWANPRRTTELSPITYGRTRS